MKCLQCGTELNGNKFCTVCGAPAPQETKGAVCSNCGQPVDGKFCTQCGTSVENPSANTVNDASRNITENPADISGETTESTQSEDTAYKAVEFQNPYADNAKPAEYSADASQNTYSGNTGYTGQQFTNQPNGTYAGQQFTNQPSSVPNGKKPMSGGKIAIIIVSIVLGVMIILGIIVGVVACTAVKGVFDVAKDAVANYDDEFSKAYDDLSSYLDSYSSYESSQNLSSQYEDLETGLVFERSSRYDGWAVVDYNPVSYSESKITIEIPEQFKGEDVVEIERLYVYDNDYTDNGYIKIIVPGTVKVIDEYSFSFLEDINEVVIEDGVEIIEEDAFIGDSDLLKVHIPASVKELDDCGIGYNDDDLPVSKDFTIYCAKGSEAEKYAKENNFKYEID